MAKASKLKFKIGDRIINNGTIAPMQQVNPNSGKHGTVVGYTAATKKYDIVYDDGGKGLGEAQYYDHEIAGNHWSFTASPTLSPTLTGSIASQALQDMMNQIIKTQTYTDTGVSVTSPRANLPNPFKVGDKVVVKGTEFGGRSELSKKKGTIRKVFTEEPPIGVEFDAWSNGHNLGDALPSDSRKGWCGYVDELELWTPPKLDEKVFDALVLEDSVKKEIMAVIKQYEHRDKLFNEWGLGETIEYGRGMTMMFWGGPGTGKTYGAHCIAKALGQELLIISTAEIQSSEPGAAERNIKDAFKAATEEGKVLFIDECDSLITTRADLGLVLAATVNCLLTEIEKFEGVCILATNRIETMDEALERRLALIVEFPFPKYAQRKDIWGKLLPKKLPLAAGITVEVLAQDKLTGGQIKNVILQASRLALAAGSEAVTQGDFTMALERLKKSKGIMGRLERTRTGRPLQGGDISISSNVQIERKIDLEAFLETDEEGDNK